MLDTQTKPEGITADTPDGPYPRLSPAAVERAKTTLGVTDIEAIGSALGFSRMNFWRARRGLFDPRLTHAQRIACQLDMPLDQVWEAPDA